MPKQEKSTHWPSGLWRGKWTEPNRPEYPPENYMSLDLSFSEGCMDGAGRDRVGVFSIRGTYDSQAMTCSFVKDYATHCIDYSGHRDGIGIYGQWCTISRIDTGGFHIWPSGLEAAARAEREESETLTDAVGKERSAPLPTLVEV